MHCLLVKLLQLRLFILQHSVLLLVPDLPWGFFFQGIDNTAEPPSLDNGSENLIHDDERMDRVAVLVSAGNMA
jgi:hypothetical protein